MTAIRPFATSMDPVCGATRRVWGEEQARADCVVIQGAPRRFAQRIEAIVDDPGSDQDIKAKMADAQGFLEALQGGNAHIGTPFAERTEAKINDLRHQIAMYQAILAKRHPKTRWAHLGLGRS
jgi:hypothetical protein